VVLATDKNDRARSRFDGAHELGHLVMHGEHVWGLKQVESQAHAFAAAFFMPDRDILDELPSCADWPSPTAGGWWQVSLAALLPRAKNLGRMTDASYFTAVKALSARGWRRQEPIPIAPENPRPPAANRRSQRRRRRQQGHAAPHRRCDRRSQSAVTEQPGRWPVPAQFGGARGQHGSSTRSGNYGSQPGTTGIAPSR
jgi:Zn-dependent peptidase ImmA (M78 family)